MRVYFGLTCQSEPYIESRYKVQLSWEDFNLKLTNFKSYKDEVNIEIGTSNFISSLPNGSGG